MSPAPSFETPASEAQPSAHPRPIAVLVDREGLGDSLLKLPFLRAVRRAYPDHPVWWIATHQTSMARELAPFMRPLLANVIENAGITTPPLPVIANLRKLPPFEMVFDSRTRGLTVLLARLFLKHRGFYCCLPGYLFSSRRPPGRFSRPRGIAARMLSLAEAAIGGPADWEGGLPVSDAARAFAAATLPDGATYVGLAPGSREPRKNWPRERFAALAERLAASGRTPVVFIGPQETAVRDELRRAAPSAIFPDTTARLELAVAIAERLAAAVANDSGIGHLLAATRTPLVSLFGPTEVARWAPFTRHGIVVSAKDFGGDTMEHIPVDAAFAAVETLLAQDGRPGR
ncbi:glycosyltransferase family 9 protein [Rhodoplanes azumiensis]|uniref:Glycosyltransferase family 9 protein n=1 Tax=Rhodoplanes azumiensis TaxID=1897628 RepID=A0ABW5APX3_9BRAD